MQSDLQLASYAVDKNKWLDYGMCIDMWLLLESYAGNLHTYFVYWMKHKNTYGWLSGYL